MRCATFKHGEVFESILLTLTGGGMPAIFLGDRGKKRVEVSRSSMVVDQTVVTNTALGIVRPEKQRKKGQRILYHVLRPISPKQDTEQTKVLLHVDTCCPWPKAVTYLIDGAVRPLANTVDGHCHELAFTNAWRCCGKGGALIVLYPRTTVRIWASMDNKAYDVTIDPFGSISCREVPEEERKAV